MKLEITRQRGADGLPVIARRAVGERLPELVPLEPIQAEMKKPALEDRLPATTIIFLPNPGYAEYMNTIVKVGDRYIPASSFLIRKTWEFLSGINVRSSSSLEDIDNEVNEWKERVADRVGDGTHKGIYYPVGDLPKHIDSAVAYAIGVSIANKKVPMSRPEVVEAVRACAPDELKDEALRFITTNLVDITPRIYAPLKESYIRGEIADKSREHLKRMKAERR